MADSASTDKVYRLVYHSRLSVPSDDIAAAVSNILSTSRRNNPAQGITGALVVFDIDVVQTLEGEQEKVQALYERIGRDPRHEDVKLVETHEGVDRAFVKWSMAHVADNAESDIALGMAAWEGGIDVMGHRALTTPDEDRVLETMRERVRGAKA
ncbi:BLUF domain-containing protein [Actinomycetospora sp. OC33-EN08]|uniref:BLUF domain-containing protein n=1 Tax=Actinomycetospora aurantiaca TaxID=3129233 RepID=A0ABU8MKP2_9PSEU